jgi:integrase
MKAKLTKTICDTATREKPLGKDTPAGYTPPANEGTPVYVWDTVQPGLALRIRAGGSRTWWIRYRIDGANRFMKIGDYPTMKPDEVRKLAAKRLGEVADDRDPAAERQAKRAAPRTKTLADAFEKFKVTRWDALSDWTRRDYASRWKLHLEPALGRKPLDKITGGDVQDLYDGLRAKKTTANHVLGLLSTVWSYAAARGDMGITPMSANPTKIITKTTRYRKGVRDRVASHAELKAFLSGVDEAEADGRLLPHEAAGLLLVPYALLRVTDVVRLRWSWVDLEARTITIPADMAKGSRIARSDKPEVAVLAKAIVERLRKLERFDELVVPSRRGGGRYEMKEPYNVVRPADDLGLYDFKTTAETMLREAGVSQAWIDAAARHRPQSVGQRHYALATTSQALKAVDKLASLLAKAKR